MIKEAFVFNIVCQMIPYISEKCIKFICNFQFICHNRI